MSYILESCVDSVESAIEAEKGGANRIELCSNLIIGGTTPDIHLFELVKKHVNIKINTLIRPRFGDLCYSDYEFEIIKRDVDMFRQSGAHGIVIGMLNPDGTLDIERMKQLIDIAQGMSITLHRAFDMCKNPFHALEQAKQLGIHTILTSGQKNNCYDGKELIKQLVEKSNGEIDILVGGGVNTEIMNEMLQYTKATSFHMSGKTAEDSVMEFRREDVSMGFSLVSEYVIWRTNHKKIAQVKDIIERYITN